MVLFSEEEAGLLEALTVESIGIFEDLAYRFSLDVLGEDDLTLLLDGAYIEAVSQRKEIVDELGVHLDLVGVEVPEEHQEQVVVVVRVFSLPLLFLSEVHREGLLENIRSTGQDYLVTVDGFTFNDEGYVAEFCYVQQTEIVSLVVSLHCSDGVHLALGNLLRSSESARSFFAFIHLFRKHNIVKCLTGGINFVSRSRLSLLLVGLALLPVAVGIFEYLRVGPLLPHSHLLVLHLVFNLLAVHCLCTLNCPARKALRVKQVQDDGVVDSLLVLFIIHNQYSTVR